MYHVSTQGIDERMMNVHYYYYPLYYHYSFGEALVSTCESPVVGESFVFVLPHCDPPLMNL